MADNEKVVVEKGEAVEEREDAPSSPKSEGEESESSSPKSRREGGDYTPFLSALKSNPFFAQLSAICHWNDPVQSALLFGIGNFFFFLITYGEYSVLTLLSYLVLVLLIVCGVFANGVQLIAHFKKEKVENPFAAKLKNPYVASRLSLEPHADSIIGFVNDLIDLFRKALYWTDFKFSVQVGFGLYVVALIGKYFSAITLLYATFVTAFVWPRLYQEKKGQIDQAYLLVLNKISFYTDMIVSKIPLGKKKQA